MKHFCLGIRLDTDFMEVVCPCRDKCMYYSNVPLSTKLSNPNDYLELDTYNSEECIYFIEEWLKPKLYETSDAETTGLMGLLKNDWSK